MNEPVLNSISLSGVCASLADALGISAPASAEPSIDVLTSAVCRAFDGQKADRIFMYNPDAVAMWLYQKYTEYYLPIMSHCSLALPLCSVMPSVTPVCFGTMYTGAMPQVHGISSYVKPVIKIDTIFDALIRAEKKPAIVSTAGDSLSEIYLERDMDYYIFDEVDDATRKAIELIEEDRYDFILLYNKDYDETMHRYSPEGEQSLSVLKKDIKVFDRVADKIKECWQGHNTLLGFAPDHGCHEIDRGLGAHGLDMPQDLNIMHFYSFIQKIKRNGIFIS